MRKDRLKFTENWNRKRMWASLSAVLLFTTVGCLKTPEAEYVTNKEGQATLISDNSISDQGIPLTEQVHAPERAEASSDRTNEYTTIEIAAKVVVPDATAFPVYQVFPMDINSERIEHAATGFYDADKFFNGHPRFNERSQEEIREDMDYYADLLERCEVVEMEGDEFAEYDEDTNEIIRISPEFAEDIRQAMANLQEELNTVPERNPTYGDPVSYELIPMEEDLEYWDEEAIETDYVKRIPYHYNISYFTGIRDNKEYYLVFEQDDYNTAVHVRYTYDEEVLGIPFQSVYIQEQYRNNVTERNKCKYSIEEAADICREVLATLDIPDMELGYVADAEVMRGSANDSLGIKGYILYFYQSYNGITDVYLSNVDNQMTIVNGYHNDMVVWQKAQWAVDRWRGNPEVEFSIDSFHEAAVFLVTDDGLVYAQILNPKDTGECLAENVKLLDFDQVLQQGLHQMENQYADSGTESFPNRIQINTIELNYACMQSPNQSDEYIMIPVWDFKTGPSGTTVISINAIDGSLFVREKGF